MDCFDALASDRQYRKALPLDEAMAKVVADAGKAFDPRVVEILQRRYLELEKLATEQTPDAPAKLSTDIKVERGSAPAAGFAKSEEPETLTAAQSADLAAVISAARNAAAEVIELKKQSPFLGLEDVFSLAAIRLKQFVPYDALAAYCLRDEILVPVFVSGENFRVFSNLQNPLGRRAIRLGGRESQGHSERQSCGRTRLPERHQKIQHIALGSRGALGRRVRNYRSAGAVSRGPGRLHRR